jgi:hypothetical protein
MTIDDALSEINDAIEKHSTFKEFRTEMIKITLFRLHHEGMKEGLDKLSEYIETKYKNEKSKDTP